MGYKKKIFDTLVSLFFRLFRLNSANRIICEIRERFFPVFKVKMDSIQFHLNCPNAITLWRSQTFFTKEPETIEWINNFNNEDVLFDIGANIGLYTIYAAKTGKKVISFEPESQNYALLNQNIYLNNISNSVISFNIALSEGDKIDYLYIPKFETGSALNNFGETIDWQGKEFNPDFKQGVVSFSLDSFLSKYPNQFPNHLKIDVDGLESKIIQGALKTLIDNRLKSVLIELNENLNEDMEVIKIIESSRLKLKVKTHSPIFDNGEYKDVYNFIFYR